MTVTYNVETLDQVKADALPLLRKQHEETGLHGEFDFAPAWAKYEALEAAGVLNIYTAREDGELIGYAAFVVSGGLHYGDCIQAHEDVLFLRQDRRKGLLGARLINFADKQLAAQGVALVSHHVTPAKDYAGLLVRLGYTRFSTVYCKRLTKSV